MKKLIVIAAVMAMFSCAAQKQAPVAETATSTEMQQAQNDITEKRWKLVELRGQAVTTNAFMTLHSADSRVSGSGGCNNFSGSFTLQAGTQRVRFSQLASTKKACFNENFDAELAQVLQTADNYSLSADGKTLSLNRARMAPLARFEVEYVK